MIVEVRSRAVARAASYGGSCLVRFSTKFGAPKVFRVDARAERSSREEAQDSKGVGWLEVHHLWYQSDRLHRG